MLSLIGFFTLCVIGLGICVIAGKMIIGSAVLVFSIIGGVTVLRKGIRIKAEQGKMVQSRTEGKEIQANTEKTILSEFEVMCSHCGKPNPKSKEFCSLCGWPLPAAVEKAKQSGGK